MEVPTLRHPPAGVFWYPRLLGSSPLNCQWGAHEWLMWRDGDSRMSLREQCWVPRCQRTACCMVWWGHNGHCSLVEQMLEDLGQHLHYKDYPCPTP